MSLVIEANPYLRARTKFRDSFSKGVKPVDGRQPIPDEIAITMIQELDVPKDALIGVFDAFLILSTHLKEAGYSNIVLLENDHRSLTSTQEQYYNKVKTVCEKSGIKYYVPPMNNYNRCDMKFDVIIGNPPYSDRSGNTSKSKDIDDKFTLIAADRSDFFSLIIRSKYFTNPKSSFRKRLFSTGKVASIVRLPDDTFPLVQNTETCIVTWSATHTGPTKVTYKDGSVVEKELTTDTVIKLDNPNFVAEVENNLAHRWFRGNLNRNKFEAGKCPIVEICGTGEGPVINYIKEGQEDIGRNTWGVVINVAADWGSLGRVMLKPYEAAICSSIMCLQTDTEQDAIRLQEYLLSEDIKETVKQNMPSFHPTKDLFKKITDPLF